MRADDQGLLDIRSLRGAGDEASEFRLCEGEAPVRLVHVVDDLGFRDDEGKVLNDEVNNAVPDAGVSGPDGRVFGDGELATQNSEIDGLDLVRIVDGIEIDVGLFEAGEGGTDLTSLRVGIDLLQTVFNFGL